MGNIINLVLDIVIIVLLVVAIIQCVRLWRKLSVFNESRKEMDATIRQFFEASAKAELAIRNFQKSAGDTSQKLDGDTKRAQLLSDELKLMIESGNGLAERLESVVEQGRKVPGYGTQPAFVPNDDNTGVLDTTPSAPALSKPDAPADKQSPAPGSIEAAADAEGDEGERGKSGGGRQEGRSRAEQELLRALQNMR